MARTFGLNLEPHGRVKYWEDVAEEIRSYPTIGVQGVGCTYCRERRQVSGLCFRQSRIIQIFVHRCLRTKVACRWFHAYETGVEIKLLCGFVQTRILVFKSARLLFENELQCPSHFWQPYWGQKHPALYLHDKTQEFRKPRHLFPVPTIYHHYQDIYPHIMRL